MKLLDRLKTKMASALIAISNVEKNALSQDGKKLNENIKEERRHTQGMLADSLLHAELTDEVKKLRWRTYKVMLASRGVSVNLKGYDEKQNPIYTINQNDYKNLLKKVKIDNFDDYDLELVFNNEKIKNGVVSTLDDYKNYLNNDLEIKLNDYMATIKKETAINIVRDTMPKFDIEKYTRKLNVRKINETEKLLEFYISKYDDEYNFNEKLFINNIKKVIANNNLKVNFLDIKEVSFVTDNTLGAKDYLLYGYNVTAFDKIVEFDGHYIIKFKANVICDGKDVLSDYIHEELEQKYNNKEAK